MTRRKRRSRFPDAFAAVLLAAGALALPRPAAAQTCCVGTGLVTPARLRPFEGQAVGMQMRARSVIGSFGPTGNYATSAAGNSELGFEEDLFGAVRLGRHFQVGVWAPFIQTSRVVAGTSGFGGGLGDVAASVRFDAVNAGERGHWPGLALLAALSLPTGQPLDETGEDDPLGTYGTGTGSYEGSLGLALEEIVGQGFVSAAGWIAKRTGRATADGVEQSFPVRLSALVAGGYTFGHDVTVGAFASLLQRGDAREPGGPIANTGLGLVTGGAALALPFWQTWRLQTTVFTDVPIAGWGRNQSAGFGGTVAVIRFWI
jgi:hypothetical protein